MKITTLVENSCSIENLKPEFGLSMLVESGGSKLLIDMGSTSLFSENSKMLGESLADVDCAVISHAHYDHGGGLPGFCEINQTAKIYVGAGADGEYYGNVGARLTPLLQPLYPLIEKNSLFSRYIGLDKAVLAREATRIVYVEDDLEILENVHLLSNIQVKYPLAEGNKFLLEKTSTGMEYDSFKHEVILVVRESDGLVLFTGCGHRNILNMIKAVLDNFPNEQIKAVVGGFHLALQPGKPRLAGSKEDIVALGKEMLELKIGKVITGHCTGGEACDVLQEVLGERFSSFSTGTVHIV